MELLEEERREKKKIKRKCMDKEHNYFICGVLLKL
jgi:hypothetical protein